MGLFGSKTILPLGSVFAGKYEIIHMVGKGGMGEVYEAVERPLGRKVAIKVISAATADDDDLLRRFKLEGKALSLVSHPNIVSVYETGLADDISYIAMEYVEGQTIHQICSNLVVPDSELSMLFLQMCEGIRVLHEKNIIHRDIKPKNIIYQNENFIKILDFGIAKFYGDFTMHNTAVGVIVGTLLYMAPEVATGSPASFQSDIWSLGAIFYEMLTGAPLIRAKTTMEALSQLNGLKIKFPGESRTMVSPEMQTIIRKMCARDPVHRYRHLTEVIADLQEFQRKNPVTDRWLYAHMCKEISNLGDIKKKLKSEGFTVSLSKRILAEAVFESSALSDNADPEKTMVLPSGKPVVEIGPQILQKAIAKVTAPRALRVDPEATPVPQTAAKPPPMPKAKKISSSLEDTVAPGLSQSLRASKTARSTHTSFLRRVSEHQEWVLLAAAVAILAYTVISRIDKKDFSRSPNAIDPAVTEVKEPRDVVPENLEPLTDDSPVPVDENNETAVDEPEEAAQKTVQRKRPKKRSVSRRPVRRTQRPRRSSISSARPEITPAEVAFTFDFRSISSLTSDYGQFPVLRWETMAEAANYMIQISPDSSFRTLVTERLAKSNLFEWQNALPGNFWWRVAGVNLSGQRSQFSRVGRLVVQLPQPQLAGAMEKVFKFKTAPELKEKKTGIGFSWSSVPRALGYYVQLGRDSSFSKVVADWHTTVNHLDMATALSGALYFRVAATDGQKKPVSAFSSPMKVSIRRILDVELPRLNTPRDGDRILMPAGDPNFIVVFSWEPVKGTQRYILQVAKDRDFNEIVLARSSTTNRHTLGRELTEGRFYWRVRSTNAGQDNAWSELGSFYIQK